MTARLAEVAPAALNLDDAARYLGISKRTLQIKIRDGEVPAHYLTSHPVLRVADLDALLDAAPTERTA